MQTRSQMKFSIYTIVSLLLIALTGIQSGVLSGEQPIDIGITDGRLKAPSATRNSVSSQARLYPEHPQLEYAAIAPLKIKNGDATASLEALANILKTMPGVTLVEHQPNYLYAQAQTRWLKFVDDLEFIVNAKDGEIDMRSASRLGRYDFGVNRKRIEAIRSAYQDSQILK